MINFKEKSGDIDGVYFIERSPKIDPRGYLERLYCVTELKSWGKRTIRQINTTHTKAKGTIRGLHFQHPPFSECKYIMCISGKVFDIVLDIRHKSPTFGKYLHFELSAEKSNGIIISEGLAHGFQTLTEDVQMLYLHSADYNSASEDGINALDPALDIRWPLNDVSRSVRDEKFSNLAFHKGVIL